MTKKTKPQLTQSTPSPVTAITSRVGIPAVTAADVATIVAAVTQAVVLVKSATAQVPGLILLDAGVKHSIVKPRTGCEPVIGDMVTGMKEFPAFAPADLDSVTLANTLFYVNALAPLQQAVTGLSKLVGDTILAQQGAAWKQALDAYAAFQLALPAHPELAPVVAPMQAFMALPQMRKPKVKKPKAPKAGAPAAGGGAAGSSAAAGTGESAGSSAASGASTATGTTGSVPVFLPTKS